MKKIYSIITTIIFSSLLFGCSSFLEEQSYDEVRPKSVDDLVQLMLGEGYTLDAPLFNYFDLLTDNVQNKFPGSSDNARTNVETYKGIFSWDERMYDMAKENYMNDYNHYEFFFKKIMGCNVILSMIDKVSGAKEARENLRGQALAMRAYYYFTLANIYAMPYTSADPSTLPAVPIILKPQIRDDYPKRASLKEVYDQVLADLDAAYPLLDEYGRDNIVYRASNRFVHTLLSRIYLYMEDYDKSIEHATSVIEEYPALQNLANHIAGTSPNLEYNVYSTNSVEMSWAYGDSKPTSAIYQAPATVVGDIAPAFSMSDELYALYKPDASGIADCRLQFWVIQYLVGTRKSPLFMDKGNSMGGSNGGMRTAELYLNRAECNARKAIKGDAAARALALSDLNTLRTARFNTRAGAYTPIDIADSQELLDFILDERRRELAFEAGHRWFDMRRLNILDVEHPSEFTLGVKKTYKLNDPKRFALPIPEDALRLNPELTQNQY